MSFAFPTVVHPSTHAANRVSASRSAAVVFPRVRGVVAAEPRVVLLREAGRPAVVNCAGIFREVRAGDRLRLDGPRALVEILRG